MTFGIEVEIPKNCYLGHDLLARADIALIPYDFDVSDQLKCPLSQEYGFRFSSSDQLGSSSPNSSLSEALFR